MQVLFIVNSDNPQILWNAFRQANIMLDSMEEVSIFLNGPSVKYMRLNSETFTLRQLAKTFTLSEGTLYA